MTVRPPYASHTLLVNLGPQSASLESCFLLLDRQARPMPVCAASRPWISWGLPLWVQDPTGRDSAAQSVKSALMFPVLLFGVDHWGSATSRQLHVWGATPRVARSLEHTQSVTQSSVRFSSCGFTPRAFGTPPGEWSIDPGPPPDTLVPLQTNSYDCGVFVCLYAAFIDILHPLSFSQHDINNVRNMI